MHPTWAAVLVIFASFAAFGLLVLFCKYCCRNVPLTSLTPAEQEEIGHVP